MKVERYNGWTNWDTWNAFTLLTNDSRTYNYMRERAKQPGFKHEVVLSLGMLAFDLNLGQNSLPNVENINYFELKRALTE